MPIRYSEDVLFKLKFTQRTFGVLIPILRRIILDEFIFATSDLIESREEEDGEL